MVQYTNRICYFRILDTHLVDTVEHCLLPDMFQFVGLQIKLGNEVHTRVLTKFSLLWGDRLSQNPPDCPTSFLQFAVQLRHKLVILIVSECVVVF